MCIEIRLEPYAISVWTLADVNHHKCCELAPNGKETIESHAAHHLHLESLGAELKN